jgi:uncharacterized membrane protein
VIIFLGNIITGVFWMRFAMKTKDVKIISHSMKGVIKSDQLFTIPGIILITAGGLGQAIYANIPLLRTGWIFWSLIMFSLSGIFYSWKVGPLQKKIYRYTLPEKQNEFNWTNFKKMYAQWEIWGAMATLTPLAALVMMVLKKPA